jgi:hypothetical protein
VSINLSAVPVFAAALAAARTIDLSAYTLREGAVRDALAGAARAGAGVRVRLERDPLDDAAGTLHAVNAETVAALRAAGADAALTGAGEPVLHLKAALVDGVAWLDDRNWAGDAGETVIQDSDPDDVAAVGAALRGGGGSDGHLRTTKAGAQQLELDVVRAAGTSSLAVESESFGSGAIYNALLARARAGEPARLLVAGREAAECGPRGAAERRRLARLAALGVEVRTGDPGGRDFDEKLAVTSAAAWVGSANATYARGAAGEQRDWGLATRQKPLVDGLRAAFEGNWRAARALGDGTVTSPPCALPSRDPQS